MHNCAMKREVLCSPMCQIKRAVYRANQEDTAGCCSHCLNVSSQNGLYLLFGSRPLEGFENQYPPVQLTPGWAKQEFQSLYSTHNIPSLPEAILRQCSSKRTRIRKSEAVCRGENNGFNASNNITSMPSYKIHKNPHPFSFPHSLNRFKEKNFRLFQCGKQVFPSSLLLFPFFLFFSLFPFFLFR